METRASYLMIGAFVLSALVLSMIVALWLGGNEGEFTDQYDIVFNERVSGLSVGSDVRFNGIKVGEIVTLKLAANNPEQVVARVKILKDTPVKEDTKAELELVGVTGLAIIQFTGGSQEKLNLKDVRRQRIPRITASPSVVADILAGGTDIIAGAQRVLDEKNTDTLSRILEDIEAITDSLAGKDEEIGQIVDNAALISEDLVVFSESLNETSKNLEVVIKSMEQVFNNDVPASIIEFDKAVLDAQLLMGQLNTLLEENNDAIDAFAQQGLGETAGAVADARRLMRTMDGLLREIERDPTKFFFGETRPQAAGK